MTRTCIYEKYWVFMLVLICMYGREGERESTHLHNMKVFVSCIGIALRCISPSECVCVCMCVYTVIIVRVCCGEYRAFAKNLLCLSN